MFCLKFDKWNSTIDINVNIINLSIGDEYRYHKKLEDLCFEAGKKNFYCCSTF